MAISYVPSEQKYVGLSSDDKSNLNQEGAKIYYTDTQNTQINHSGVWYDYNDSTKLNGSLANQVTFQNAVSATGNGASLTVGGIKNLTVGITSAGGNTARTIEFHGVDAAGNDNLISGVNKNGLSVATSTTATGETWQFDITGLVTVYMKLTVITAGTVTVAGMVVA